jgi:hypothetical protein
MVEKDVRLGSNLLVTQWLEFIPLQFAGKTVKVEVRSRQHGDVLGTIAWWASWRCYVFHPGQWTVFNAGCLADIQAFLVELMEARQR